MFATHVDLTKRFTLFMFDIKLQVSNRLNNEVWNLVWHLTHRPPFVDSDEGQSTPKIRRRKGKNVFSPLTVWVVEGT